MIHHSGAFDPNRLKLIVNRIMESVSDQAKSNGNSRLSELNRDLSGMGAWANEHPKPPYKPDMEEDEALPHEEKPFPENKGATGQDGSSRE